MAGKDEAKDGDDEDVPELVNTNFEKEAEKWEQRENLFKE